MCIWPHYSVKDDVSFTRSKGENYTFQEEDQFPCTISGLLFAQFNCFDRYCVHYNVV